MKRLSELPISYKYFLSYTIILSVPLLLIGGVIYQYFFDTIKKEVTHNNLYMLTQVQEIVDMQMKALKNISFQISMNGELTPYRVAKNGYQGLRTINELRKYTVGNSFIYDVMLYYHHEPYLYSSYSTYPVDTFAEEIYGFQNWSNEDFLREVSQTSMPAIRSAQETAVFEGERAVVYLMPIPQTAPYYGTAIFIIKESSFNSLMKEIFSGYGGQTFIFNKDGEPVTLPASDSIVPTGELSAVVAGGAGSGTLPIRLDESGYLASYITSPDTGWTFVTLIEEKKVMFQVARIKQIALVGLLITLALGLLVSYLLMRLNYRPIQALRQYVDTYFGKSIPSDDEFEIIRHALRQMSDSNQAMRSQIQRSRPALKKYWMHELLKGNAQSLELLGDFAERDTRLTLSKSWFRVVMILFDHAASVAKSETAGIIRKLEEEVFAEYEGFATDTWELNIIVFVYGSDTADHTQFRKQAEHHQQLMKRLWNIETSISVGNAHPSPAQLGKSYIEAKTAMDYRLIKGKKRVLFFRDLEQTDHEWYINKYKKELEMYIYKGEIESISNCLSALTGEMKEQSTSLFAARMACYDLINLFATTMQEMRRSEELVQESFPDVIALAGFETIDDLAEALNEISRSICRHMEDGKRALSLEKKSELLHYVERHYTSYDFSLQSMAEAFHMSPPYLSKMFREQIGMTLTQYVNRLRIEKAKELLQEGEESLQTLVGKIGYANVSSFIRKFKDVQGVTPGDYRKRYYD